MTGHVIDFDRYHTPPKGNGARDAMIDVLRAEDMLEEDLPRAADHLLTELWVRGFKIVPLGDAP